MKYLKFVLVVLASMFSLAVNAQPRIDPGVQPMVYGSGQAVGAPWGTPLPAANPYGNMYGGYGNSASVQYHNQNYGGQYGNQPLPAVGAVQGGMQVVGYETETRTRPCTPQEEYRRTAGIAATTTFVGGLIGQLRGHNRNSTGQGAGYGLAAGLLGAMVTDCTVDYTVRVPILRPVAVASTGLQQAVYNTTAPAPREVASRCAINGKVWRGLSEAQCDELALELSKTKTVSAQNTAPTHEPKQETAAESKENNPCPAGRIPLKLTKRGHALEGKTVCTKEEFRNHPDFQ